MANLSLISWETLKFEKYFPSFFIFTCPVYAIGKTVSNQTQDSVNTPTVQDASLQQSDIANTTDQSSTSPDMSNEEKERQDNNVYKFFSYNLDMKYNSSIYFILEKMWIIDLLFIP